MKENWTYLIMGGRMRWSREEIVAFQTRALASFLNLLLELRLEKSEKTVSNG